MSSQTRGRRVAALVILAAPHALALVAPMHAPPRRAVRCNYVTPQQVAAAASADDLVYGRGTMADLSSIVALAEEEFGKDYTDPISKFGLVSLLTVGFGLRLNRDDHAILTCKAGTDLLGYVEVSPQPAGEVSGPFPLAKRAKSFMGPLTPYLANLLVRPDARRRGVGGALVIACEQEVARWGGDVLGLHHDVQDQKLLRFYNKLGFAGDAQLNHQGFVLVYVEKPVRPS